MTNGSIGQGGQSPPARKQSEQRSGDDELARLALSAAFEPGRERLGAAVAQYGAVGVVESLSAGNGNSIELAEYQQRWSSRDWLDQAKVERRRCADEGIRVVVPGGPEWPTQLTDLGDREPLALRVLGGVDFRAAAARSIAMVGARAASQYGQWVAEDTSARLAQLGWAVVSGGAFGIDAACHHGALAIDGGISIAVSAAGVDRPTPASHSSLFERLYRSGVVVSEVPVGAYPNRHRFLIRNRVIAALSPIVVVVEAAVRSGALNTAREAQAMGRVVAAFPGPVTSSMSAGCHGLIRDTDAALVTSATEVIDLVVPRTTRIRGRTDELTIEQDQLLSALTSTPTRLGVLVGGLGVDERHAAADAFVLERLGLIRRLADGWVRG